MTKKRLKVVLSDDESNNDSEQEIVLDENSMIVEGSIEADEEEDHMDEENDYNEEEDPVEHEIDVFYSGDDADSLFLFQYPNRKADLQQPPTNAQIKPLSSRIKLDFPVNSDQMYYSPYQAETLGRGLNSDGIEQPKVKNISLVSSTVPLTAKYMTGLLKPEGLYLLPLANILQLRPSLDYLDIMDEKDKSASQKAAFEEALEAEETNLEEDARMVHLTVRATDDKDMAKKMEQMDLLKKEEEEKWLDLRIHQESEEESKNILRSIFTIPHIDLMNNTTANEYLDQFSPKVQSKKSSLENAAQGLAVDEMINLSLREKVLSVLLNAQIITLDLLKKILIAPEEELVSSLAEIAFCIKGTWIIHSKYIYKDRVLHARNYLLSLFQSEEFVSRDKFNQVARLPLHLSRTILEELAVLEPKKGWFLKYKPDQEFVTKYSNIISSQKKLLEKEATTSLQILQEGMNSAPRKVKTEASSTQKMTQNKSKPNSTNLQKKLDPSLDSLEMQLEDLIIERLKIDHVCSLPYLMHFINERKNSGIEGNLIKKDLTKDTITSVLNRICFTLRGVYILKEVGRPELHTVWSKVVDCFRRKKTVKLADIKQKLKDQIETQPTDQEWIDMLEMIAEIDGNYAWVF